MRMENLENNAVPGEEQEAETVLTPAPGETAAESTAPAKEVAPAEAADGEAEAPAEEAPAEEEAPADEDAPAEEEPSTQEEPPVEMKKGLSGTSAVALAAAAVILLAAIVAVLVMNGKKQDDSTLSAGETTAAAETTEATVPADGNPEDVTCKGSYTADDETVKAAADTVVATAGDHTLTVGQLQVHYWLTVQNFLSQYGSYAAYFGLDVTQPLDTQICTMAGDLTWQQYFLSQALSSWETYEAVAQAADENGFQLSEENQQELDGMLDRLETLAQENGYGTAADMIATNFGASATVADYQAFWELYFRSNGYYSEATGSFTSSDEEIAEYWNAHEAEFAEQGVTKETKTVDVRHILITPESTPVDGSETGETTISDDAWATAQETAQKLLDQYLAGDKTEDSFAALANENSQDPGSNTNGGLYTGVTEGQMVQTFNDWCFDSSRQVGDTGIVQTSYGYHVMLYCGSQTVWQDQAKSALLSSKANTFVEEAMAAAPVTIDYSAIRLGLINLG